MQSKPRIHHLYVSVAKHLFIHPEYGMVKIQDPISLLDAKNHQLSPVLLYGLTVATLPIRFVMFEPMDNPVSINSFLNTAWQEAEGLKGVPDVVIVNKYLNDACPSLAESLSSIGVELQTTLPGDRSHSASLRSSQGYVKYLDDMRGEFSFEPDETPCERFSTVALCDHDINMQLLPERESGQKAIDSKLWLKLPIRPLVTELSEDCLDWQTGDWLHSWENNIPPGMPRYFYQSEPDEEHWLMTGTNEDGDDEDEGEGEGDDDDDEYYYDDRNEACDFEINTRELIKIVLANWSCKPVDIARECGITLRDLNWYLKDKISLQPSTLSELKHLLGIERDRHFYCHDIRGSCVIHPSNKKALDNFYNEYTGGGDGNAFEIIPSGIKADPDYHYIFIVSNDKWPVLLVLPRKSEMIKLINDIFIYYQGSVSVDDNLYQEALLTCEKVQENPVHNKSIMMSFARKPSVQLLLMKFRSYD